LIGLDTTIGRDDDLNIDPSMNSRYSLSRDFQGSDSLFSRDRGKCLEELL